MRDRIVYKVLTVADVAALDAGVFAGTPIDLADGFIHLSTGAQLTETVARHFSGQQNLTVAAVDLTAFSDAVRWELSRNGQPFPHLYAPLVSAAIVARCPLGWDPEGNVRQPLA